MNSTGASTIVDGLSGVHKDDANGTISNSALEEEAALLGAVADDAEADYIRSVLNNEIVIEPDHLLSRLLPIVVHVCTHPSRFTDADLQVGFLPTLDLAFISIPVCYSIEILLMGFYLLWYLTLIFNFLITAF